MQWKGLIWRESTLKPKTLTLNPKQFRVWCLRHFGFRVWGLAFAVQASGFGVWGLGVTAHKWLVENEGMVCILDPM